MMFLDPDNPMAAELLKEAGQAYFAACKKMVKSLEALKAFDQGVGQAAGNNDRVKRRSQLLDDATESVLTVVVQREAMRLSGFATFFEDYEVPAEVIARMGKPRSK